MARLIETEEEYIPDEIDEDNFNLEEDPHGIQQMLFVEAHKARAREIVALRSKMPQLYALFISTCSSTSVDVLKEAEECSDHHDDLNTAILWQSVLSTHKLGSRSTVMVFLRDKAEPVRVYYCT